MIERDLKVSSRAFCSYIQFRRDAHKKSRKTRKTPTKVESGPSFSALTSLEASGGFGGHF